MVSFIRDLFQPAFSPGHSPAGSAPCENDIVALALGALALFSANAFERKNPGLATVLRCISGGMGLIYLFNRCCPTSAGHHSPHHVHHPVVHAHPPHVGSPPAHSFWDWLAPQSGKKYVHPAPVHFGHAHAAPPVHVVHTHAHAHPAGHPHAHAHAHAAGHPHVHHAHAVHPHVPASHSPKHAHLNLTQTGNHGGFPQVHPAHGGGFPTVHRAAAQPDPHPVHQAPLNRGFPTVHLAAAQPDPHPIHQAPVHRAPMTATFPAVHSVSHHEAAPQVHHMHGGNASHQDNQRPIFPAAVRR